MAKAIREVYGETIKKYGELNKDSVSNKYSMNFNRSAVNEDITVTLYYVAGTAKYTVKHYYQNLEDGSQ